MARLTQFPEPPSLNILEVSDGKDNFDALIGHHTIEKPHPGYGKDPNILNHYGHTVYPKMVYPQGKDAPGVIVNSHEHELEVMGDQAEEAPEAAKPVKQGNDW